MYYFASDVHLGLGGVEEIRKRERMFVRWLDEVSADAEAIALVGDVFDFWFEWKRVVPRGFTRVLGKLSELTDRGVRVHFFTGNHDMWVRDYLSAECGIVVHERPEVFEACGRSVFVAHGDNLYLRGTKPLLIKMMNGLFYSRFWRWAFSTFVHPDCAMRFGSWWSQKSRKSHSAGHIFRGEGEYLVRYAREYARCVKVDYFVFGHLHSATEYDMDGERRVVVLGDWSDDGARYAVLRPDGGMELRRFE